MGRGLGLLGAPAEDKPLDSASGALSIAGKEAGACPKGPDEKGRGLTLWGSGLIPLNSESSRNISINTSG